ncbi:MAG TPA: ABC transporter ATP-binding protein [Acidimicrobiia bacterium]|nr:ABC transporter ATP-binding protein [Acidimicrobiia bacterium]HIL06980.1 ABC transporter ATP-binding protein [Acidimicrobiia bacterium]
MGYLSWQPGINFSRRSTRTVSDHSVIQEEKSVVLELLGVEKSYPGNPPVGALRGIDLLVRKGELLALVGTSGSGKSTMLNVMGALDRPTAGNVFIEGQDLSNLSDRQLSSLRGRRIGFIFQQFHLIAGMSAVENVSTGLLYQGISRSRRNSDAIALLHRVGLGDRLGHLPHQLSGGEQQRVAIARALMGEPAIILADELTGNLDSKTSEEIIELLHQLNGDGSTIVVVTHDGALARSFPGMVTLLDGLVANDSRAA